MDLNLDKNKFTDMTEELLSLYPTKVGAKRTKSIISVDSNVAQSIQANVRTIPGVITQRGCTYAGCKGVVLGPTRDIINITHGPIGCGFYSWLTRRSQTRPESPADANFLTYCFSTDLEDSDIVFGGENKLKQAIREAYTIFKPKTIAIFSTCPVGLIGDDVHRVAKQMMEELGECVNIFAFSCEGYRGVSQSAGHHIASNGLFKHLIGRDDTIKGSKKFRINLLGEYNIGGDAFEIERIFEKCGIQLVATFSGNAQIEHFENAHTADLNLVMCHRSINYVAEMMEKAFGIPWIKVQVIGADSTAKMLRKIGTYFEDKDLIDRIESVINEEMEEVKAVAQKIKIKTQGKTAMLFLGGSRAHHYQALFNEIGITIIAAGYEFGHRDDYEGRHVIPTIRVSADNRNIEELAPTKDSQRYFERKTEEDIIALEKRGLKLKHYSGMMKYMEDNSVVIDDITQIEMDMLIEKYHPDIFCAGIKEKFFVHKTGIPSKQLHNYDSGGPYAGFKGAINFYKDIEMMLHTSIWNEIKAPWEK